MTKEKPGFLTPKAISNKIKSKGLQKLRWYCQMCQKQCRDENGYKCHTMSESHNRQIKLFAENGGKFVSSFSAEFLKGYLDIVRRQFGGKRVHANVVYQEYIKEKDHIHMNATRWHTLTGLCMWLGKQGICKVDETEKGWFMEYIDRDPEKMKRQESSDRLEKTEDEINRHFLDDDAPIRINLTVNQPKSRNLVEEKPDSPERRQPESDVADERPQPAKLITFGPKKAKPLNPLLLAEQKAREERAKSSVSKSKPEVSTKALSGSRKRALDEVMQKEEALKDKRNRRDYWMTEGLEVKLVNRKLPDSIRLRHAAIIKTLDNYTAIVEVLNDGTKIKVDQDHVQTVIPSVSSTVLVINGAYRGEYATLEQVNKEEGCCDITIATGLSMGRLVKRVSMDDVCKLVERRL
ncbi:hypothetical protein EG68_07204 [Paragonimus skrjabini miyazakii]|uniref:DNA/RNA-binding protein Kin17 WH-like domain-containing protein n=1 Tax=Paragonimus skrjabini miyazakii TaxID=59628 RepID=A0A8S9YE74_9TREM|nr:hypothetical protein EG68_07204 [Paragonimus skrjabini miyazakii]